jgi:RNA polymerase sigma factor (sigma-70 family)
MQELMDDIRNNAKILDQKTISQLYPKAHKGDKEAIRKICLSVWRLAASKSHDMRKYDNEDVSDYVSVGMMGVLSGIKNGRYDEKKGAFSTYVTYYISGFILRERDTARVIKGSLKKRYFPKCDGQNMIEDTEDTYDGFIEIDKADDVEYIKQTIKGLSEIQQDVITSFFLNNETLTSIGKRLNRSKERIRQIREEAVAKIKMRIGDVVI